MAWAVIVNMSHFVYILYFCCTIRTHPYPTNKSANITETVYNCNQPFQFVNLVNELCNNTYILKTCVAFSKPVILVYYIVNRL